jgi:uncharacterized surface protein with fasciclin (FAS1) repeats
VQGLTLENEFEDPDAELTLLAPTDSAFEALDQATLAALLDDKTELLKARNLGWSCLHHFGRTSIVYMRKLLCDLALLRCGCMHSVTCITASDKGARLQVISLHVLPEPVKSTDLMNGTSAKTLLGSDLLVTVDGGTVTFIAPEGGTEATVVEADLESCKGIVHIIDAVLLPGEALAPGALDAPANCTTLLEEISSNEELSELGAILEVRTPTAPMQCVHCMHSVCRGRWRGLMHTSQGVLWRMGGCAKHVFMLQRGRAP